MSKQKKKQKKVVTIGIANIQTTFNNTLITISDILGNTLCWSSSGASGFKGAKKNTPYAAQVSASEAAREAYELGLRSVVVYVKGPGSGREAAIRAIDATGVKVTIIQDTTPLPHNGCRPPKKRRV